MLLGTLGTLTGCTVKRACARHGKFFRARERENEGCTGVDREIGARCIVYTRVIGDCEIHVTLEMDRDADPAMGPDGANSRLWASVHVTLTLTAAIAHATPRPNGA